MRGVREAAAREPSGDEYPDDPVVVLPVVLPVDRPVPVLFLTRRRRFLRASAISGKMVFRSVWKWGRERGRGKGERDREREIREKEREGGRESERRNAPAYTHMQT